MVDSSLAVVVGRRNNHFVRRLGCCNMVVLVVVGRQGQRRSGLEVVVGGMKLVRLGCPAVWD